MAPRLRVVVSDGSSYPPKTVLSVNSAKPTPIKTDGFEGEVQVWVKGFEGEKKGGDGHEYFGTRSSMTYAIVVRGKFKEDIAADDLLFGNIFEKPIKDNLPYGTSIAQKAIQYIEPTIQLDLYAEKPWALSYALASLNHLSLTKQKVEGAFVNEKTVETLNAVYEGDHPIDEGGDEATQAISRKKWMANPENRKAVKLSKDTYYGMEFCNGYLNFNDLSLSLPGGYSLSFDLLKYWDGQPATYVCSKRGPNGLPGGQAYWSVAFEIVDEDARKALEKRGGAPLGATTREGEEKADLDEADADVD